MDDKSVILYKCIENHLVSGGKSDFVCPYQLLNMFISQTMYVTLHPVSCYSCSGDEAHTCLLLFVLI